MAQFSGELTIFVPYNINLDVYSRRDSVVSDELRQIVRPFNHNTSTNGFRLEPNWNSENDTQNIRIAVSLDDIDKTNLALLETNKQKLNEASGLYSVFTDLNYAYTKLNFVIDITLNNTNKTFSSTVTDSADPAFQYLQRYDLYRQLIQIYNQEHINDALQNLQESFTLISGYRNYNSFTPSVSLSNESAAQIQEIRQNEFTKSANSSEQTEPPIFNLVRLRIAEKHYGLIFTDKNDEQATKIANSETFIKSINEKLALIDLKVEIKLIRRNSWSYTFNFIDTKRNRILSNINSLSAGQKAIIHLIFEAYGRGDLKGGVIIIDEPEIHLHYQFQHEYLKIIEKLNSEQNSQFILVTHSEALISSKTIDRVKRFALDNDNYTIVRSPRLQADQKTLIKILDNTRSTYAFFARKVVLVEGDTDRYFFKAVFNSLKPELNQEIAIIDIGGKGNFGKWRKFFEEFGLTVYYIGDFDNVFNSLNGTTIIEREIEATTEDELKQGNLDNLSPQQLQALKSHFETLVADATFLTKPQRTFWKPLLDTYIKFSSIKRTDLVASVRSKVTDIDTKVDV